MLSHFNQSIPTVADSSSEPIKDNRRTGSPPGAMPSGRSAPGAMRPRGSRYATRTVSRQDAPSPAVADRSTEPGASAWQTTPGSAGAPVSGPQAPGAKCTRSRAPTSRHVSPGGSAARTVACSTLATQPARLVLAPGGTGPAAALRAAVGGVTPGEGSARSGVPSRV